MMKEFTKRTAHLLWFILLASTVLASCATRGGIEPVITEQSELRRLLDRPGTRVVMLMRFYDGAASSDARRVHRATSRVLDEPRFRNVSYGVLYLEPGLGVPDWAEREFTSLTGALSPFTQGATPAVVIIGEDGRTRPLFGLADSEAPERKLRYALETMGPRSSR